MNSRIPYESYAAVDLGSNSFHMLVANYNDNRLQVIDRLKEMVRLASGLDQNNFLTDESMDKAIKCLERFGQRIRELPRANVRAVGTNTLRKARNGNRLLTRAYAALGHPIEIISGLEEARLIYQGVAHSVYDTKDRRLVIDIGGGSTELILGQGFQPHKMESLYMGCVGVSQNYFNGGEISAKKMRNAILFARQELESIEVNYVKSGWDSVIGSSGSILSIRDVIKALGWSDDGITGDSLAKLKDAVITIGSTDKINFAGLSDDRKPVFAGGVAILCAIFEALQLQRISCSDGALREGLLYDMLGRLQDEDVRDKTINEIAQRYSVDTEQAERIKTTVTRIFDKVEDTWGLAKKPDLRLIQWAAQIHEIGLAVSHAQYHRHGAYLISNSYMPGFSNQDQVKLATLVRVHRRKFPEEELQNIPEHERDRVLRLCILFRLAVLLNRSRFYSSPPKLRLTAKNHDLKLSFPDRWLQDHPLTQADLESEAGYLQEIGFKLVFK
ncbi:MAG: exopolyphosphatase [Gammaproteobacteria bacterium RIFCSPLOWO2_12_FULL_52_10]|nr:MAG: exopolyphosphatase [Gammaproteobacteria bacterium RIFCSPLOWO2_12_FULL_52_10]